MTKQRPDEDDSIHVASSGDMTGFVPTPPLTDDEEDAYASLGAVPAAHGGGTKRKAPGADRCGGGR